MAPDFEAIFHGGPSEQEVAVVFTGLIGLVLAIKVLRVTPL